MSNHTFKQIPREKMIDHIYNSNAIEGNSLGHKEVELIVNELETLKENKSKYLYDNYYWSLDLFKENNLFKKILECHYSENDIIETVNHWLAFDYVKTYWVKVFSLQTKYIKLIHRILRQYTRDDRMKYNVGEFKSMGNIVGGRKTTHPNLVQQEMEDLVTHYILKIHNLKPRDILLFHRDFERIHPFQDGNGRVGRFIMFLDFYSFFNKCYVVTETFKDAYYPLFDYEKTEELNKYCDLFEVWFNTIEEVGAVSLGELHLGLPEWKEFRHYAKLQKTKKEVKNQEVMLEWLRKGKF